MATLNRLRRMQREFDAIVVGAGVMGTATAAELSRRGLATLALERFSIGHKRGSSGGPTRIFRFAYDDAKYVRMAGPALDAWRELEERAGETLLVTTGGLDVGEYARLPAAALESAGVAFDWIRGDEAMERWPGLRFSPNTPPIVFQPDAGVCFAGRTVRALARLSREQGATIMEETIAERVLPSSGGVEVVTSKGAFRAPVAIVAAGPWAGPLLSSAGVSLPLEPSLEQVSFFELDDPSPLPIMLDWTGAQETDGIWRRIFYSVPNPDESGAFKLGLHHSGPRVDPAYGPFPPDPIREATVADWAAERYAPHRSSAPTDTCLYTNTPDVDFVMDRIGSIVVGSPCSGHGFKFAPLVGKVLAALAMNESPPIDLDLFRMARFGSPVGDLG